MKANNKLLQRLSARDRGALTPYLELVPLARRQVIVRPWTRIEHVYFPECGLLAVHAKAGDGMIEVGMIGSEGMSDMIPAPRTPLQTIVHVPGEAYRIKHDLLAKQAKESSPLAELTFRYHQFLNVQLSYTALSHGHCRIDQRLARWLLMAHDRLHGPIPITHDLFAWILAIRRSGVSEMLAHLEVKGCIEKRRGQIEIINRPLLLDIAGPSYGPAEKEYKELVEDFRPD